MDYQEAIKTFEIGIKYKNLLPNISEELEIAIAAMQELQALHNQGISLEQLKDIDFRKEVVEHINYNAYMSLLDELEEYRQLGDLEEVRESMQELQIYKENEKRNLSRTDRLMDECAYRHENGNCLKVGGFCTSVPFSHCQGYKDWYAEYRGYKQLGTLEEVRDAVEKQNAKKPKNVGTEGYRYTDTYRCPTCGGKFSGTGIANHCYHCGQKLNWEDVE